MTRVTCNIYQLMYMPPRMHVYNPSLLCWRAVRAICGKLRCTIHQSALSVIARYLWGTSIKQERLITDEYHTLSLVVVLYRTVAVENMCEHKCLLDVACLRADNVEISKKYEREQKMMYCRGYCMLLQHHSDSSGRYTSKRIYIRGRRSYSRYHLQQRLCAF